MKKVVATFSALVLLGTACINIPDLPKAASQRKKPLIKVIDAAFKAGHITSEERDDFKDRVYEAASNVPPLNIK